MRPCLLKLTLCAVFLVSHGGCGYRLLYPQRAFSGARVAIVPFAEEQIAGLSGHITQALAQHLAALGWDLAVSPEHSDARLSGSISLGMVPGTTLRTVAVYVVEARVHAMLHDRKGQLLWQTDVALEETFLPTDPARNAQPMTTEMRRRTALMRLGELCAQRVGEALMFDAEQLEGALHEKV